MQRYQTRSTEFGLRKREYALGEINLGTLKGQRLRQAQTSSHQQPKERGIGCSA
jgi:hypothetical protein